VGIHYASAKNSEAVRIQNIALSLLNCNGQYITATAIRDMSLVLSKSSKFLLGLCDHSVIRNVTFIGLLAWYSDMREDQNVFSVSGSFSSSTPHAPSCWLAIEEHLSLLIETLP
jgi:hypothetical protein